MYPSICGDASTTDVDVRSRMSADVDVRSLGTSTSVDVRSVNRPLYNVVDRAPPHTADDLSVNHGGVAIFAGADINIALSPIDVANQPTMFEIVSCARARVGCFASIVVLLYRPGCSRRSLTN